MSMRTNRRTVALCGAALTLLTPVLAGCGSGSNSTAAGGKPLVGVDYPRSDTDFWNSYIKYVPQFAKKQGVSLKTTNSQNKIDELASNVQTLASQGAKGIVMAPQDTAAVKPTLQNLANRKIPVVSIDTRPDAGKTFMVVRADNRAYGEKSCRFLGAKLKGKGKVVVLEGDLNSINGRDRTDAFNSCMKQNYPGIKVVGEPTNWDQDEAGKKLATVLNGTNGIYMEASFGLAPTLQLLKQRGLDVPPSNPKHVFVVSNDGIPEELANIKAGKIDATVSQPADQYAKYGLYYIKAAIDGKTFKPGPTDHGSKIIRTPQGALEDQLPAPLVTADGGTYGGVKSLKPDDTSLWGNHLG